LRDHLFYFILLLAFNTLAVHIRAVTSASEGDEEGLRLNIWVLQVKFTGGVMNHNLTIEKKITISNEKR